MQALKSRLGVSELVAACAKLRWTRDGTGIMMANGQWNGLVPDLQFAVGEIETLLHASAVHVMVNRIEPGGDSGWHVDPEPRRHQRWHLPVTTNPSAVLWCPLPKHLALGYWHGPVRYWDDHRVVNGGSEDRIHLIVDLEDL